MESFFKARHFILGIMLVALVSVGGFYIGVVLANPPIDVESQTNILNLLVQQEVIEKTGRVPAEIVTLDASVNLQTNILDVAEPQVFLVRVKDPSEFKASFIESLEEGDSNDVSNLLNAVVDPVTGQVTLFDGRY